MVYKSASALALLFVPIQTSTYIRGNRMVFTRNESFQAAVVPLAVDPTDVTRIVETALSVPLIGRHTQALNNALGFQASFARNVLADYLGEQADDQTMLAVPAMTNWQSHCDGQPADAASNIQTVLLGRTAAGHNIVGAAHDQSSVTFVPERGIGCCHAWFRCPSDETQTFHRGSFEAKLEGLSPDGIGYQHGTIRWHSAVHPVTYAGNDLFKVVQADIRYARNQAEPDSCPDDYDISEALSDITDASTAASACSPRLLGMSVPLSDEDRTLLLQVCGLTTTERIAALAKWKGQFAPDPESSFSTVVPHCSASHVCRLTFESGQVPNWLCETGVVHFADRAQKVAPDYVAGADLGRADELQFAAFLSRLMRSLQICGGKPDAWEKLRPLAKRLNKAVGVN